jgi:thioredoxin reductase (NADPH)
MENKDIIIVGAGVAGLSCALYLARASYQPLLLESGAPGGKLLTIPEIANYPGVLPTSGPKLASSFLTSASQYGVNVTYGSVQSVNQVEGGFLLTSDIDTYFCKALVVATGLKFVPSLKGEKEFLGRGVSYCATCDGNFFKGLVVGVYGDNEQSVIEALYLAKLASKVYFLTPKSLALVKGSQELSSYKNIEVLSNVKVNELKGDKRLSSVEVTIDGQPQSLPLSGFFPLVGEKSSMAFLSSLKLQTTNGFINTNEEMETSLPGLFAIGDIRVKSLRQVVTASSDGATASSSVIKYLRAKK